MDVNFRHKLMDELEFISLSGSINDDLIQLKEVAEKILRQKQALIKIEEDYLHIEFFNYFFNISLNCKLNREYKYIRNRRAKERVLFKYYNNEKDILMIYGEKKHWDYKNINHLIKLFECVEDMKDYVFENLTLNDFYFDGDKFYLKKLKNYIEINGKLDSELYSIYRYKYNPVNIFYKKSLYEKNDGELLEYQKIKKISENIE